MTPREGAIEATAAIDRLSESIEQLGEALAIITAPRAAGTASTIVHVNDGFARLFGWDAAELSGRSAESVWGPLTDRERMDWLRSRIIAGEAARVNVALYTKDGMPLWMEVASNPVRRSDGDPHHIIAFRDISARKQFEDALAAEKRKLQTTLAAIADAVITVLPDGRVEFINEAAQQLLDVELADAYGLPHGDVLRLFDGEANRIDIVAGAHRYGILRGFGHARATAGTIDVSYVASRIDGEDGVENAGTVVVLRDVTDEHRVALRLTFEASHDPLTGLQNRRAFMERLDDAVTAACTRGEYHAVAFMDLDRFKAVNDRFGHAIGDRLLREIGQVMGRAVRAGDVVARIGGDEFGLLLANCRVEDARRVAEKVREAVDGHRLRHHGELLGVGISIGIAAIEAGVVSAAHVLADADAACYLAKAGGRNAIAG